MSPLQKVQEQVDEVTGVMFDNFKKMEERAGKFENLNIQAEELNEKSKMFKKTTRKLKGQKKHTVLKVIVCVAGAIALVVGVVLVVCL